MTRGRKPKPPQLKILDGNPGQRKIPEVVPGTGAPTCPSWLPAEGKAEWRRIVPALDAIEMLDKVDRAALTAYCQAFALLRAAEELIAADGLMLILKEREFTDDEGNVVTIYTKAAPNPAVRMASTAAATVRAFCSEFGLTPSSRARLPKVDRGSGKDGAQRLLS